MADVGLQTVNGQDHLPLVGEQPTQAGVVGQGDGQQLVVAVQEVSDGALGDVQAATAESLVDLGNAAVLAVAEVADQRDDIEAKFVLGQGVVALGFGSVGFAVAWTVGVMASSDVKGESEQSGEGGDGASVLVVGPQALPAGSSMRKPGLEVLAASGLGSCCRPGHSSLRG